MPYWFWGQKVKGQGHGLSMFENGFRTITDSVINLWSWNFIHLLPMSQGCALLILGSKGQRSRSWRMVIWKWSTEIMVADLNLLGSVGDLYCFSNTFSMLLHVAPICCPSCYHNLSTYMCFSIDCFSVAAWAQTPKCNQPAEGLLISPGQESLALVWLCWTWSLGKYSLLYSGFVHWT